MRFVLALLAVVVVMSLASCASPTSIAPSITPALVTAAGGTSRETLNEGRRIFMGPCTTCHAPDPVSSFSLFEWRAAIDKMAPRARLDDSERTALIAYLTAAKISTSQPAPR